MSKPQPYADVPTHEGPAKPIIYKSFEYVKPSAEEDYVLVREFRTFYFLDGRVAHETVLMEMPFEHLVRAFDGTMRKIDGLLTGWFNAPEQAQACARKIDFIYGKLVEVNGNQLSMTL
ncbi:MAG: hypothetical protein ACOYMG_02040 [Candidatus Methylumidiphilus sp.]